LRSIGETSIQAVRNLAHYEDESESSYSLFNCLGSSEVARIGGCVRSYINIHILYPDPSATRPTSSISLIRPKATQDRTRKRPRFSSATQVGDVPRPCRKGTSRWVGEDECRRPTHRKCNTAAAINRIKRQSENAIVNSMKKGSVRYRKSAPKSFTIGRAAFARISAVEGIHLIATMNEDFREFERQGLSPQERRAAISRKYAKVRIRSGEYVSGPTSH